jgi:voltage-gated potassium channel Kch
MRVFIYLLMASGIVIFVGTMIMYNLESQVENSKMKTVLDALWWCIATVSTVGYGDVVPVTNLGRIVAIIYMFFGITLIAILLAVVTNTFYKKRIDKEEISKKEYEINYLRTSVMNKLLEIERKQLEYTEATHNLRLLIENRMKFENSEPDKKH